VSGNLEDKTRAGWSYSGETWTDADGRGVVLLPSFVRAHDPGFDYELTPIESDCSATVAEDRGRAVHGRNRRAARQGRLARHRPTTADRSAPEPQGEEI
jgi:hypothetical protein